MTAFICSGGNFATLINSFVLPLVVYASIASALIVAGTLMIGKALSNDKLTTWAQGEIVHVIISVAIATLLLLLTSTFCSIQVGQIGTAFGFLPASSTTTSLGVYDAAEYYLVGATVHAAQALTVVRYHYEAYTVLGALSAFFCNPPLLGCLFGQSGTQIQPLGGYGAMMAALGLLFNSMIITYFSSVSYLLILVFVETGFPLLFLPLGIVLRSMPYLRSFGSLMIALAVAFMIVYPFIFATFYLVNPLLFTAQSIGTVPSPNASLYNEGVFPELDDNSLTTSLGGAVAGYGGGFSSLAENYYYSQYFSTGSGSTLPPDNISGAIILSSSAFIVGVFLPSVAMLATLACVAYIARFFGEEMDLSRLTQVI